MNIAILLHDSVRLKDREIRDPCGERLPPDDQSEQRDPHLYTMLVYLFPDEIAEAFDNLAVLPFSRGRYPDLSVHYLFHRVIHLRHLQPLFIRDGLRVGNGSHDSGTLLYYRVNRVACLAACRSSASAISRSSNSPKGTPVCSHILGYMLIDVKPGIVLISLMYSFPVAVSSRKSTRPMPAHSTAR